MRHPSIRSRHAENVKHPPTVAARIDVTVCVLHLVKCENTVGGEPALLTNGSSGQYKPNGQSTWRLTFVDFSGRATQSRPTKAQETRTRSVLLLACQIPRDRAMQIPALRCRNTRGSRHCCDTKGRASLPPRSGGSRKTDSKAIRQLATIHIAAIRRSKPAFRPDLPRDESHQSAATIREFGRTADIPRVQLATCQFHLCRVRGPVCAGIEMSSFPFADRVGRSIRQWCGIAHHS